MPTPVLETRDLSKRYGATLALDALSLSLERGEVFGFLGPNGAGKTTTIRLLLDLIRPTRGEVRLFGRAAGDPAARAGVGFLPDEPALDPGLTGRQTLRFFDALRPAGAPPVLPARRAELCDRLGLTGPDLDRRVRDDSRGTRQKLALAAALQRDPDLLILDEPTTGLDPLVRDAVLELLREAGRRGRTVFHSSHVLSEVERSCTRVGVVRAGRLVATEAIDDLRRRSVRRMVVRFEGEVPLDELRLPGIEVVEAATGRAVLRVEGTPDALLKGLARHRVAELAFPEPDLEEAFVRAYREGAP
jgi:ABC-2 type transport system ATP-binding protein